MTSASRLDPLSLLHFLRALKSNLKTMASAVFRLRQPLVFSVLSRTVGQVLSIGLVVRRCFPCSAGNA